MLAKHVVNMTYNDEALKKIEFTEISTKSTPNEDASTSHQLIKLETEPITTDACPNEAESTKLSAFQISCMPDSTQLDKSESECDSSDTDNSKNSTILLLSGAPTKNCELCSETFKTQRLLRKHRADAHPNGKEHIPQTPTPELELNCSLCTQSFETYNGLMRHRQSKHPNWREIIPPVRSVQRSSRMWKCKGCDEIFERRKIRDVHMRKTGHHTSFESSIWRFPKCPERFDKNADWIKHEHRNVSIEPDDIECEKMTSRNVSPAVQKFNKTASNSDENDLDDLETTALSRSPIDPAETDDESEQDIFDQYFKKEIRQCELCPKTFNSYGGLYKHMRWTHLRSEKTDRKKPPESATDQPTPLPCGLCEKSYCTRGGLRSHWRKKHPNCRELIQKVNAEPQDNRWKCRTCDESFRTRILRTHHTKLTGHRPVKRPPSKTIRKNSQEITGEYICDICGKICNSRKVIMVHMRRHIQKEKSSYLCSECGASLSSKTILNVHIMAVHRREKPYKCTKCDRCFSYRQEYKDHLNRHDNIRPYQCQKCPLSFTTNSGYRIHLVNVHSNEKKYTCKICGKGFAVNGNLTAHIFMHSGETPHPCPNCAQGFMRKNKMLQHLEICKADKNL